MADREMVADYLMTIKTEHSMPVKKFAKKIEAALTLLLGYETVTIVSEESCIDVYGVRPETDDERQERLEDKIVSYLEASYEDMFGMEAADV